MTNILHTLDHLDNMSKQAALPLDKVATVIRLQKQHEAQEERLRRSSPEYTEAVRETIDKMNGELVKMTKEGVSRKDIAIHVCKAAGVPRNQGTASVITRAVKQLLLTHKSAE